MQKSDINHDPGYFNRYIDIAPDLPLRAALDQSLQLIHDFDWDACEAVGLKTYAEGKWTIPVILQHLIDWERIMTYRALVFERQMYKTAQGMDEDILAAVTIPHPRKLADIKTEMLDLRKANAHYFTQMPDEHLLRTGKAWKYTMSPLSFAYTIMGHQEHHFRVIRERYLTLT